MIRHITHPTRKLFFVALFSLLAGLALGATFHKETVVVREGTADSPAAMSSVNLMLDDGEVVRTWNTVSWREAFSVLDLLYMVSDAEAFPITVEGTDPKLARLVSVGRIEENETHRWQYWVNNVHEPREADRYFLKPGDIVVWKFAPKSHTNASLE
jgi:hypothetical protein